MVHAYGHCSSLTSITLPNSVTSISHDAFYWCKSLTSITIPNSVTSIGEQAFYGCRALTSITLPSSVAKIANSAFRDCDNLSSIISLNPIPPTLGDYTFSNYSATLYVPQTSIKAYKVANYWKDFSRIKALEFEVDGVCYKITSLSDLACAVTSKKNKYSGIVEIPNAVTYDGKTYTVTAIENGAFNGCSGLKMLTIADGDSPLQCGYNTYSSNGEGKGLFYDCPISSLYLGRVLTYTEQNKYGYSPFKGDGSLENVFFGKTVSTIGAYMFSGCSGLTSITIPNTVASINDGAFNGCTGLTDVVIEDGLDSLKLGICDSPRYHRYILVESAGIFENCPLESAYVGRNLTYTFASNDRLASFCHAFAYNKIKTITIGDSVTSIGKHAFEYCTALEEVSIGSSVTSIGKCAFFVCKALTGISIGNSVTSIGEQAFFGCTALEEISIGNSVTSIEEAVFGSCRSLTNVIIPNSVTSIGQGAFEYCTSLKNITIPSSVTSIAGSAFSGCSGLTSIQVDSGNKIYDSRESCNAIIETASNTLITGCVSTSIPNSVTSIGDWAFGGCSHLQNIAIPNSVTSFGKRAFSSCSGLENITIPNSVISIGDMVFYDCSGLKSITTLSFTPPTLGTKNFTDEQYASIPLYVPQSSIETYKAADGWKNFYNILAVDSSGIESAEANGADQPTVIYDIQGRRLNEPQRGINIINGKKVLVK